MSLSCRVTFADASVVTYDQLGLMLSGTSSDVGNFVVTVGQYLIDLIPSDPIVDQRRFHVVGADGNALIRCGNTGGTIDLVVRYINRLSVLRGNMTYDQWAFANMSCTLLDDGGETWSNMNLVQGSAKQIGKIRPTGWVDSSNPDLANQVLMCDAVYTLMMDGAPTGSGSN